MNINEGLRGNGNLHNGGMNMGLNLGRLADKQHIYQMARSQHIRGQT